MDQLEDDVPKGPDVLVLSTTKLGPLTASTLGEAQLVSKQGCSGDSGAGVPLSLAVDPESIPCAAPLLVGRVPEPESRARVRYSTPHNQT